MLCNKTCKFCYTALYTLQITRLLPWGMLGVSGAVCVCVCVCVGGEGSLMSVGENIELLLTAATVCSNSTHRMRT
jgi:hypothetical protein